MTSLGLFKSCYCSTLFTTTFLHLPQLSVLLKYGLSMLLLIVHIFWWYCVDNWLYMHFSLLYFTYVLLGKCISVFKAIRWNMTVCSTKRVIGDDGVLNHLHLFGAKLLWSVVFQWISDLFKGKLSQYHFICYKLIFIEKLHGLVKMSTKAVTT